MAQPVSVDEPSMREGAGEVFELTKKNYERILERGNVFVTYYAPWCGHCKELAPIWEQLAKELTTSDVIIAKIDCTRYASVCERHNIRGYPTLIFHQDGERENYRDSRSLEDLKEFVDNKLTLRFKGKTEVEEKVQEPVEEEDKPVPSVVPLDQDTFSKVVAEGVTFVKFYAPWCGHCKQLAPIWEQLSVKFFHQQNYIRIAKIDCTEQKLLCQLHKVRGYPTLLLFYDGEIIGEYNGPRSLESLENFVNKKVDEAGKSRDEL